MPSRDGRKPLTRKRVRTLSCLKPITLLSNRLRSPSYSHLVKHTVSSSITSTLTTRPCVNIFPKSMAINPKVTSSDWKFTYRDHRRGFAQSRSEMGRIRRPHGTTGKRQESPRMVARHVCVRSRRIRLWRRAHLL